MKTFTLFLLIIILILNSDVILAQDNANSKYSTQLDIGGVNTLHYQQPVFFGPCYNGCTPEEQKSKLALTIKFSRYRHLNNRSSIKMGLGFSMYRFSEKGQHGY